MPMIRVRTSVGATSTVDNVLTGSAFEYLPYNAGLEIGMVQLTGSLGDVLADVYSGTDILGETQPIPVNAGGVLLDQHLAFEDVAAAGERLKIRLRNTTGGAIVVDSVVRITQLG